MFAAAPLPSPQQILARLNRIFPEGITDRRYLVQEVTAKTIFVMLYVNAVEGETVQLSPKHVYRMTEEQSFRQEEADREQYASACRRQGFLPSGRRWYQDNTREVIRDEVLRSGLVDKGMVILDNAVPTNSAKGRYTLKRHFARLFILTDEQFEEELGEWQENHLSPAALAAIRIRRQRQAGSADVSVTMPDHSVRRLEPGLSSSIAKAVIEEFAPRHLNNPAVLWISEGRNRIVHEDNALMRLIGLEVDHQRLLPDIVLADTGRDPILIVFVEVVATDGPITPGRKAELSDMCERAGLAPEHVAFVSAFEHRDAAPLKRRFSGIATDTLIWCVNEPELLIWLQKERAIPFSLRDHQPL